MKLHIKDLSGPALDWAVAICEGFVQHGDEPWQPGEEPFAFTTDWAHGGPIIDRSGIGFFCNRTAEVGARFRPDAGSDWRAFGYNKMGTHYFGPTPLVAAMRCYVTSQMGDEIEIPDELVQGESA